MAIDRDAPLRFLRTAYHPDDWVAILLKAHGTGATAQRVGPLSLVTQPRFQAWLRAQNARRFSVYVSVNAIRLQRKARTRDAIGEIRHLFLDADRDGPGVLAAIARRRDLPTPSLIVHSSPNRLHVLWRVQGFTKEGIEALQKALCRELATDRTATSCAQMTRLPGFLNHKYTPAPAVRNETGARRVYAPAAFPDLAPQQPPSTVAVTTRTGRASSAVDRARRYIAAIPPAVAGQHGDDMTFRVCCRLVRGFDLDDEMALAALMDWNVRRQPPWSEEQLRSKLAAARRYGREPIGALLSPQGFDKRPPAFDS